MSEQESAVFAELKKAVIIAVLIIERAEDAAPLARALYEGGVRAMELTLRTPVAFDALRAVRAEVPEMLAGLGTILTPDQARRAVDEGASFGVSPGVNRRTIEAALAAGLPFAPGICTPSDIETALEYDRKVLKFFPAEPSGGLKYLETVAAPYAHLGVGYIPLGGVNPSNCSAWLSNKHVVGIGGSWLAPKELIAAGKWSAITDAALQATAIRDSVRPR